jgi:hypothetical protein
MEEPRPEMDELRWKLRLTKALGRSKSAEEGKHS